MKQDTLKYVPLTGGMVTKGMVRCNQFETKNPSQEAQFLVTPFWEVCRNLGKLLVHDMCTVLLNFSYLSCAEVTASGVCTRVRCSPFTLECQRSSHSELQAVVLSPERRDGFTRDRLMCTLTQRRQRPDPAGTGGLPHAGGMARGGTEVRPGGKALTRRSAGGSTMVLATGPRARAIYANPSHSDCWLRLDRSLPEATRRSRKGRSAPSRRVDPHR
jgi:hypothetical protein